MVRTLTAAFVAVVLAAAPAQAGKFNKAVNVGDKAPTFSGLAGVDDKSYSLSDFKDKDVVVVVFTCNHCPVAVAYEDRIINFAKKFASPDSKVGLIAICCNDLDQDKLPAMKVRAKKKGFNFPYVYDESQKAGRSYGAKVTPEFFVLDRNRKIVYMGAMDDKQSNPSKNFLEPAVEAALKGSTVAVTETRARGCSIKYSRK
jgi:peroxiredoxin